MSNLIGGILLIAGATFLLIGALGVLRFETPAQRLHAGAKGPTLGLLLVGSGTAVKIGSTAAVVGIILLIALQLLAGPLGSHMIARVINRSDPQSSGPLREQAATD